MCDIVAIQSTMLLLRVKKWEVGKMIHASRLANLPTQKFARERNSGVI